MEYHTKAGVRARIHLVMMQENGQAEDYLSEYMQEVYSGVFFKEFVLFFGENIQYYIMEDPKAASSSRRAAPAEERYHDEYPDSK